MSFEERSAWLQAIVLLGVPGWYFAAVLGQARGMPVAEIAYQSLLLWNVGIVIVSTIAATVVVAIAAHLAAHIGANIESAVEGELGGRVAGKARSSEVRELDTSYLDRRDERDASIGRFAGSVAGSVLAVGSLAPLALTMMESEHFWIAQALYAVLVVSALVSSAVKIVAYRRSLSP